MKEHFIYDFIAILVLIFLSGFFSSSETSIIGSNEAKIHKLKEKGIKRAEWLINLKQRKESVIATILLGNNIVNILASAIATDIAIKIYGDDGIAIVTLYMTFMILIFGEILPKTYAVYHAENVAIFVAPIIRTCEFIFKPIIILLQLLVRVFLKIVQRLKSDNTDLHVEPTDIIRGEIALHHKAGTVIKPDKDMLDSILDMKEMEVDEIMIHRRQMFTIDGAKPVSEIINLALESGFSRIPIYLDNEDNVIGICSMKAIIATLREYHDDFDKIALEKLITKPWFIPNTTKVSYQLSQFRSNRNHLALVVDEYGVLQGMITIADIIEEIIGDVKDEHDNSSQYQSLNDGSYKVQGTMTIRDINRELSWEIDADGATTIAGFLIKRLGFIPDIGHSHKIDGMIFTVIDKDQQQITFIKIKKT